MAQTKARKAWKVLIFRDGQQYGAMGPYIGSSAEKNARNDAAALLADRAPGVTAQVIRTRWNPRFTGQGWAEQKKWLDSAKASPPVYVSAPRAREMVEEAQATAKYGPWVDQLGRVMGKGEHRFVYDHWMTMRPSASFTDALLDLANPTPLQLNVGTEVAFTVHGREYPDDGPHAKLLARFMAPPDDKYSEAKWNLYRDWAKTRRVSKDDMEAVLEAFDSGMANHVLGGAARERKDLDEIARRLQLKVGTKPLRNPAGNFLTSISDFNKLLKEAVPFRLDPGSGYFHGGENIYFHDLYGRHYGFKVGEFNSRELAKMARSIEGLEYRDGELFDVTPPQAPTQRQKWAEYMIERQRLIREGGDVPPALPRPNPDDWKKERIQHLRRTIKHYSGDLGRIDPGWAARELREAKSELARLTRAPKPDPFAAIQRAIKEVWSQDSSGAYSDLPSTWGEWLRPQGGGTHGLASIYHEYRGAPPEPFSYEDPDAYKTWEKVSKLASKYAGQAVYIESINPGESRYFYSDPHKEWEANPFSGSPKKELEAEGRAHIAKHGPFFRKDDFLEQLAQEWNSQHPTERKLTPAELAPMVSVMHGYLEDAFISGWSEKKEKWAHSRRSSWQRWVDYLMDVDGMEPSAAREFADDLFEAVDAVAAYS